MKSNKQSNDSNKPSQGFLKLMRSPETETLLVNDPLAFALLAVIAIRARWRTAFDVWGLNFGEALMGDYREIGFTRSQYRTRLKRLQECGLVTTRPSQRGTIVRLTSTSVFKLFCLTNGQNEKNRPTVLPLKNGSDRPTDDQQTTNRPPLTNNDKKQRTKEYQGTGKALGNSTPLASSNGKRQSGFLGEYQNHADAGAQSRELVLKDQPAQSHVKWPEFVAWCRSKGGKETESGFWKWLCGQKPQWRNKVRQDLHDNGFELNGKFYTRHEAQQLAVRDPELITKFRKAVKRNSQIQILSTNQTVPVKSP
jgi:hypothetical protein